MSATMPYLRSLHMVTLTEISDLKGQVAVGCSTSVSSFFDSAYLNAKVRFDIQSAVMERPSVDGLIRAFTHMSIICDPRAPKDVPRHIKDALPRDPKIFELEKERKTQRLVRKINSTTKKWEEVIKKEYRRQYFYRIHNEELQRQLNRVETEEYVEPVIHHQLLERTQLQEVICHFPKNLSPEDVVQRRIRVIDLMVALCSRREAPKGPKPRSVSSSNASSRGDDSEASPPTSSESPPDPEPFPLICEKTPCFFFCNGKTFSRPAKMMDHVESHLRRELGETVACRHPVCEAAGLVLENVKLFKLHVQTVHGIKLRDPRYVK